MSQLEIVGLRAIEYVTALNTLRKSKYALIERMALYDKGFNGGRRVTRENPLYENLEAFCFYEFREKYKARSEANNAKRRLMRAVLKHESGVA
ncbi:hypothetical protein ALQ20_01288 [Pseudomonas syringae pv. atrofaciens]|uniref:hypothetical protein n=1 Tax=Pseudomonas syringae TaxID=317 RepID=UPI000F008611|nr:hypothetical protein [Pseudomonas syringae]RMP74174.1 hypothetical protein ALQ20_01288 [Pseudomonas syringae pv. atrofaciens]